MSEQLNHEQRIAKLEKLVRKLALENAARLVQVHQLEKNTVHNLSLIAEGIKKPDEFDLQSFKSQVGRFLTRADQLDAAIRNDLDFLPPSSSENPPPP